jgi:short-subunit dehydrogenase
VKLKYTVLWCPIFISMLMLGVDLNTKKAIVIGASHGIGKEVATILVDKGYHVGLVSRNTKALARLQKNLGGQTITKKIDITKPGAQKSLDDLIYQMNGVDVVVISAGIWPEDGVSISWEDERNTIATNVSGFVAMANIALNHFIQQGSGHLVGVSSVDAVRGSATAPAYCASKAFVSTYMEGMRNKFIQSKLPIYVTDVRPGYVKTYDIQESAYWVLSPEQAAQDIYDAIVKKQRIIYTTKRWWIIAKLLQITPDFIYNKVGGF